MLLVNFSFFYCLKSFYRHQPISSSQLDTKLIQVLTIVDLDCRQAALLAVDLEPLAENEWQVDWVVAWLLLVASAVVGQLGTLLFRRH